MEAESLYYQCCERIDNKLEVAEHFLIGCIMFIRRDRGEKSERIWIENEFKYCNYNPYIRELRFISTMHDDSLKALIASSVDLSVPLKILQTTWEHMKYADYDKLQGTTHANKAKQICKLTEQIGEMMKPTRRIKTDSSLFEEGA